MTELTQLIKRQADSHLIKVTVDQKAEIDRLRRQLTDITAEHVKAAVDERTAEEIRALRARVMELESLLRRACSCIGLKEEYITEDGDALLTEAKFN